MKITKREKEHLYLVALGCKNGEIASILTISVSTVKKTLENVFRKLKAKDRAHAVAIGFAMGIITPQILTDTTVKYNISGIASPCSFAEQSRGIPDFSAVH